jgi:hypothetical protein
LIAFKHTALGFVTKDVRDGMETGWAGMHDGVRRFAETTRTK